MQQGVQFVPVEAPLPRPQFGRYREVAAAALLMLGGAIAFPSYATIIVLGAMGLTAIAEIVMSFLRAEDDDLTRPAIAFSIILFALLLGVTFKFRSPDHPWVYPGPRELTGSYLVNRLQEPPPPPPPEPEKKVGAGAKAEAASDQGEKKNSKAASKGEQGKAGGKGDVRAADPDVKEEGPPPPEVGFMTGRNRKELDRINELDHLPNLAAFGQGRKGPKTKGDAGMGKGSGIGVGDDLAHSSLRFSLGRWSTKEQIDFAIEKLTWAVNHLRELSPLWDMHKEGIDISTIEWAHH